MNERNPETFDFDVFLSHSSHDKALVRDLAGRLKKDGLRVWFDEWEIRLGDPIYSKVREGLERSRILLLFMSRNSFGSDWPALEYQTSLFADPLNRSRRFIPLRLDEGDIPSVLRQFKHLDWQTPTEDAYHTLLLACQTAAPIPKASDLTPTEANTSRPSRQQQFVGFSPKWILKGHEEQVQSLAVTADGRRMVSGSDDATLRVWDLETGTCTAVLEGHRNGVYGLAVDPVGRLAISGGVDHTVRVWDLESGTCTAVFEGHKNVVYGVAISPDGRRAFSVSNDKTLRVWDLDTGTCTAVLEGHKSGVTCVAATAESRCAITGSIDHTVGVWDLDTRTCTAVLEGHKDDVWGVAMTPDGRRAVSGSKDKTLRVWDLETGTCTAVLEGHKSSVRVAVTPDGRRVVSGSIDRSVRVWDLESGTCIAVLEGHKQGVHDVAVTPDGLRVVSGSSDKTLRVWDLPQIIVVDAAIENQTLYTNAKVLLTGDSGAGKTGLAQRLVYRKFEATYSTDGVWATQLKIEEEGPIPVGVEREIWVWDFAGQADYRLIHQLYMDGTDLALMVFDPQKDDPFEGLAQWDQDLTRAGGGKPFTKRLVAGRCDRGGLRVSQGQVDVFRERHGFAGYHETSALTGDGCDKLRKSITESIPWGRLPKTTSPTIFRRIKEEILKLKDGGRVLLRMAELKQVLEMQMIGEPFTPETLQTVVELLANAGVVWPLDFGGYVLLHPERINSYAGSLVRAVRAHIDEIGCIAEADVLAGRFPLPEAVKLEHDDEEILLRAMVKTFLERGLCLKEPTSVGSMLVFPAYFRRERPILTEHPPAHVQYRFTGALDEVYTTLVVRLHHTELFERDQLWRDAADFKTPVTGLRAGLKLNRHPDSSGVLTVFLDPRMPIEIKATFMKFVHDHLKNERARWASGIARERFYICDKCDNPLDNNAVRKSIQATKTDIYCQFCDDGHRVLLLDEIEELFRSPETAARAEEWNREAQAVIDSQSLEQILLGHVQAIAGEAGQIWRPTSFGDWGIDGEIEFKDQKGLASGERVYLQLKSGNSYLETRKKDGAEIFRIKRGRHANYWQKQAYPVWLVIRTTDVRTGTSIRWMNLSAYLKKESKQRKTPIRQVEFRGEPLTAQTLMALRDTIVLPPND